MLIQDRRDRVGFENQLLTQTTDDLVALLPKRNDRHVLRVSEPKYLEYPLIYLPGAGLADRKAQVVSER